MTYSLSINDRIAPQDNPESYLEVLDPHPRGGCIKVFDPHKQEDRYISAVEITDGLYCGKLILIRHGKPRFSVAEQPDDPSLHERTAFIRTVMKRIRDFAKRLGISFRKAYLHAADEYAEKATPESPPFPSQAAVYRYKKNGLAGLPALQGDRNKGNRTSRYPQKVIQTICHLAKRLYLVPNSRWTLKKLTEAVNREVFGSEHPSGHSPISKKYVKQVIKDFLTPDLELYRMLPKETVAGKSFAKRRFLIQLPFERVEQDALHLPYVVSTPSGLSRQVYLVHAIDCCTGYPLGWLLVIGGLTDSHSLACAEMYMGPLKSKRFDELGLKLTANMCGTPGELVFDNGAEAKGGRIQRLERLGIDVRHCRAMAGHEKPFIERLNRSLKEALECLPGCTRLNGEDGKRDPVALGDQLMTPEQLEHWIVRWYYEKWVNQPLERLGWDAILTTSLSGNTPAERWACFENLGFPLPLPPTRADWLATLYEQVERKLSRKTGVTIEGLHFKSHSIAALIGKYGEQQPVVVLYNPDDFRHVYVNPGNGQPLVVIPHEHLRPETPAWSFKEAKEHLEKQRAKWTPAPEAEQFNRDLYAFSTTASLSTKPKRGGKHAENRETAKREKAAKAISRAVNKPLPTPPPNSFGTAPPADNQAGNASVLDDAATLLPVLNRSNGETLL